MKIRRCGEECPVSNSRSKDAMFYRKDAIFIIIRNRVNTSMLHILTVVQLLIPRMWKLLACVGDAGLQCAVVEKPAVV